MTDMKQDSKTTASTSKEVSPFELEENSSDIQRGEVDSISEAFAEAKHVRQGLHQRHIQMIAIAGTIGTGLFLSSGKAIARSGPLGALLAYCVVGVSAASVVLAIGELGALVPLNGGIVRYSEHFFDPAMSFANGWNLVYSYLTSIPAEIVAAAVIVEFWRTIDNAVWITVFSLIVVATGFCFVRVYGELEFGFAILKIMLIVGINIMALVITCGGGPQGGTIGFEYWRSPGPFVQYLGIAGSLGRFLGFWTSLNNAVYSYSGIEVITAAAAETRNPRQAIPKAAKRILVRVLLFYVLTIFMVGLVVPSNNPNLLHTTLGHAGTAAQSPFVIAATLAGIKVVPSIINAVILTSAFSSANSNMLTGSRVLYGMAVNKHAPAIFKRISRWGIAYVAVIFYSLWMCLGYLSLSSSAATVFNWLQDIVAISTIINWIVICVVYLRFYYGCKKQGINRHTELPWAAPLQPYLTWFSLVLFVILLFTGGYVTFIHGEWSDESFVSSYLNIPLILIFYFGFKWWKKTKIVRLEDMPIREFLRVYQNNPEPIDPKPKGLRRLNILWT